MGYQLTEPVKPVEVWPRMTVNEPVMQRKGAGVFRGGNLANAVDIYERVVKEGAYIFLTLAGALTPSAMRKIILTLIKKIVNAIVSTGANLVHDTVEALGGSFYKGSPYLDESQIFEAKMDRICDTLATEEDFTEKFDNQILGIYAEIDQSLNERVISINDSVLGLQLAIYNRLHKGSLRVDAFEYLQEMWDIRVSNESVGAVVLVGGVLKNYVFQFFFSKKRLDYLIQITLDRPETWRVSDALPQEAVSWGKVKPDAYKVVVLSEVPIAPPIIVAALLERLDKKWATGIFG